MNPSVPPQEPPVATQPVILSDVLTAVVNRAVDAVIAMESDPERAISLIVSIPRTLTPCQSLKRIKATELLGELNPYSWTVLTTLNAALMFQLQINGFSFSQLVAWMDEANAMQSAQTPSESFLTETTLGISMERGELTTLLQNNRWLFAYYLLALVPITTTMSYNTINHARNKHSGG